MSTPFEHDTAHIEHDTTCRAVALPLHIVCTLHIYHIVCTCGTVSIVSIVSTVSIMSIVSTMSA